jgi:hypothetical protein
MSERVYCPTDPTPTVTDSAPTIKRVFRKANMVARSNLKLLIGRLMTPGMPQTVRERKCLSAGDIDSSTSEANGLSSRGDSGEGGEETFHSYGKA